MRWDLMCTAYSIYIYGLALKGLVSWDLKHLQSGSNTEVITLCFHTVNAVFNLKTWLPVSHTSSHFQVIYAIRCLISSNFISERTALHSLMNEYKDEIDLARKKFRKEQPETSHESVKTDFTHIIFYESFESYPIVS